MGEVGRKEKENKTISVQMRKKTRRLTEGSEKKKSLRALSTDLIRFLKDLISGFL